MPIGIATQGRSLHVCVLVMILMSASAVACDSPSSMFTGRWEQTTRESVDPLGGWPVVAMGHYGDEVAGVTYLYEEGSIISYLPSCPCVWIDHYRVDLSRAEVQFTTRCEESAAGMNQTLHWHLEFQVDDETGEELLVGTVAPEAGEVPTEPNLRLVRTQDGIVDKEKQCPPEEMGQP